MLVIVGEGITLAIKEASAAAISRCLRLREGAVVIDVFFFSSRRRHTRLQGDWSSDVCSSDLVGQIAVIRPKPDWVAFPSYHDAGLTIMHTRTRLESPHGRFRRVRPESAQPVAHDRVVAFKTQPAQFLMQANRP